jgi:hypothetical protein
MGADFLQKTGKTIKVARDRDLIALAEETLFTRRLERPLQFEVVRLFPGQAVVEGEELQVERSNERVVVVRFETVVGEIERPMASTLELVDSCGVVGCRVDEVRRGAGVCDVEITE